MIVPTAYLEFVSLFNVLSSADQVSIERGLRTDERLVLVLCLRVLSCQPCKHRIRRRIVSVLH
jgi:hypothetical protein